MSDHRVPPLDWMQAQVVAEVLHVALEKRSEPGPTHEAELQVTVRVRLSELKADSSLGQLTAADSSIGEITAFGTIRPLLAAIQGVLELHAVRGPDLLVTNQLVPLPVPAVAFDAAEMDWRKGRVKP